MQINKTPLPTEGTLKLMLENDLAEAVQQMIDEHKLNFKIVDGKLVDSLMGTELWLKKYITIDADTNALKDDIMKLSKCDDEVLIFGETGTGKEILARALIGNRDGRSVVVNCAGLPEQLMEAELFGHKKGSFTGADSDKQGLMQTAKNGILFLDEIGELPIQMQGKLLRAIQERSVRRVGGTVEEEINCKFVFATNRNIAELVDKGLFRQDLYARISTFELHVKPLVKRKCDIEPICESLKGKEFYQKFWTQLHDGTLSLKHNVRSLQQYIKRWQVLGKV